MSSPGSIASIVTVSSGAGASTTTRCTPMAYPLTRGIPLRHRADGRDRPGLRAAGDREAPGRVPHDGGDVHAPWLRDARVGAVLAGPVRRVREVELAAETHDRAR